MLGTLLAAAAWSVGGCDQLKPVPTTQPVPSPINMLLPKSIHIHPLTGGSRVFEGGLRGLEVQLAAKDSFGNTTKAFGDFVFELYDYRPNSPDPKGPRIAVWEESTLDPKLNSRFWDETRRMYEFRLQWDYTPTPGRKFVVTVRFSSPFSERLFAQYTFITGE